MSTVLITVSPEASLQMRPPRALYPRGFKVGNIPLVPGVSVPDEIFKYEKPLQ